MVAAAAGLVVVDTPHHTPLQPHTKAPQTCHHRHQHHHPSCHHVLLRLLPWLQMHLRAQGVVLVGAPP